MLVRNVVAPKLAPVLSFGRISDSSHSLPNMCDACNETRYVYLDWLALDSRPPAAGRRTRLSSPHLSDCSNAKGTAPLSCTPAR
eukprot:3955267-Pleurochrysis_carterae.AAC.1